MMLYLPFGVDGTDCRIEPGLFTERIRTGLGDGCFRAVVIHVVTIWAVLAGRARSWGYLYVRCICWWSQFGIIFQYPFGDAGL